MAKAEIINFLKDEFSSIGYTVRSSANSNTITVYDNKLNPIKEYYYKSRNSTGRGFWGPMESIVNALISSTQDCSLILITETKIYSLNKNDIANIPQNFKLNTNKQYMIFEDELIQKINPFCYYL